MTGNDFAEHAPISASEFRQLGIADVAYLRPRDDNGHLVFAIYSADGTELAVAQDRSVAIAFLRDHDLEPVSVH